MDAIKLEAKSVEKELLTWMGWTVARQFVVTTTGRPFGSFWEHAGRR
jgi:hypothetical protein